MTVQVKLGEIGETTFTSVFLPFEGTYFTRKTWQPDEILSGDKLLIVLFDTNAHHVL